MYLVEGTLNKYHQENIDSIHEPSDPEMIFINSTIQTRHTNTSPQTPTKAIGFGPHCHTPATTTVYPDSPVYQRLQQRFQPAVTRRQIIVENTTDDTPLLAENFCNLSKFLTLLRITALKDDTQISLRIFYDEITLNLTASINK